MRRETSKSGLFLMEIIFVVMFFSICCAVSAKTFAKAHIISDKSLQLNGAISIMQTAVSSIKAANGNLSIAAEHLGAAKEDEIYTLYYDKSPSVSVENIFYRLEIKPLNRQKINISIYNIKNNTPIIQQDIVTHSPIVNGGDANG